MNFDSGYFGPQGVTGADDEAYAGSRFADVRAALFANRYYDVWGEPGDPPLPTYGVTLGRALRGVLPFGRGWRFLRAARRTVRSDADLRRGPDGRGFRRILHPNGVCLLGRWEIDEHPEADGYTGYFAPARRGLIVGRYSTCCSETRRGHFRSLSLVGKIYPTEDPEHAEPLRPANFIAQDDLGGRWADSIDDPEIRNAPDVTPWRRGLGVTIFLVTALVLLRADRKPAVRQLYPIAELGKPPDVPTRAPRFMRLIVDRTEHPRVPDAAPDFRDEILSQMYDRGHPEPRRPLVFRIEVTDRGRFTGLLRRRLRVEDAAWKRVGRIVFDSAVASYNGDFVLHFAHPPWRTDHNDPGSVARRGNRRPSG